MNFYAIFQLKVDAGEGKQYVMVLPSALTHPVLLTFSGIDF